MLCGQALIAFQLSTFAISVTSLAKPKPMGCYGSPNEVQWMQRDETAVVDFFSVIADDKDPCLRYICYPTIQYPGYTWSTRFDQDKCCKHDDLHITVGSVAVVDQQSTQEINPCSERVVRCQLSDVPNNPPEAVVEIMSDARCCWHENKILHPGEVFVDASRCAFIKCELPAVQAGPILPQIQKNKLTITKVYENSCGCCSYKGGLVRDGEFLVELDHQGANISNITCMKGNIYRIERMSNDDAMGDYDVPFNEPDPPEADCQMNCTLAWPEYETIIEIIEEELEEKAIDHVSILVEQHGGEARQFARLLSHLAIWKNTNIFTTMFGHFHPEKFDRKCSYAYSLDALQGKPMQQQGCPLPAATRNQTWMSLPLKNDFVMMKDDAWKTKSIGLALSKAVNNIREIHPLHLPKQTLLVVIIGDETGKFYPELFLPWEHIQNLTTRNYNVAALGVGKNRIYLIGDDRHMITVPKSPHLDFSALSSCVDECNCNPKLQSQLTEVENVQPDLDGEGCTVSINRIEQAKDSSEKEVHITEQKTCEEIVTAGTVCSGKTSDADGDETLEWDCRMQCDDGNFLFIISDALTNLVKATEFPSKIGFVLDQNSQLLNVLGQALTLSLDKIPNAHGFVTFYSQSNVNESLLCHYGYSYNELQDKPLSCDFSQSWKRMHSPNNKIFDEVSFDSWPDRFAIEQALDNVQDAFIGNGEEGQGTRLVIIMTEDRTEQAYLPFDKMFELYSTGSSIAIVNVNASRVQLTTFPDLEEMEMDYRSVKNASGCLATCKCDKSTMDEIDDGRMELGKNCTVSGNIIFPDLNKSGQVKGSCDILYKPGSFCSDADPVQDFEESFNELSVSVSQAQGLPLGRGPMEA